MSKRNSSEINDNNMEQQQQQHKLLKRRSVTIDILQKLFPKMSSVNLEQTLTRFNADILKTIEHLMKEGENGTEMEHAKSVESIPIKLPIDNDFSEIRKQFGFNKKKPKNSFVRHKANYENALREQAIKGSDMNEMKNVNQYESTMSGINETSIGNPFALKNVTPHSTGTPMNQCPPQLLSMFGGNQSTNGGTMSTFRPDSTSPINTSPNLISGPISTMTNNNNNNCSSSQKTLLNVRGLMLHPSLMMPNGGANPMLSATKIESEPKMINHGPQTFVPGNLNGPASFPHLSRNLFDSLMASTSYRNLFPAFFPGSTHPNLASLGLLGTGLAGLASAGTNESSTSSSPNMHQANSSSSNYDHSCDEFNHKLLSQRTHQIQSALHNMCDNNWYGNIGNDLTRSNGTNGGNGNQLKCENKDDLHS